MAWGVFNKIRKGFKKVGEAFKSVASSVNKNVIKPVASIAKTAANTIIPGSGGYVDALTNFVDYGIQGNMGKAVGSAVETAINTNKNIVRNAVSTIGNAAKNIGSVATGFVGNSVAPLSMVTSFIKSGRS